MTEQPGFRDAMARFPTGVTIVTTRDMSNRPHGFTATSFCSVSLNPPLILVCLAKAANSYPIFQTCARFAVSVLGHDQIDLARRFAAKRPDKFAVDSFVETPSGLDVVGGAPSAVECLVHDRHDGGDHVIIVGRVCAVRQQEAVPMVYVNRAFGVVRPGLGIRAVAAVARDVAGGR
jgi:flavin reductase ActVB